ncbi:hypothetical protein EON66_00500 [archaeon]|nr:MAG: hypothetical protein EON66_00500 [archaeon]
MQEFLLTRRHVTIPEKPQRIYSCNEANYASFPVGFQRFLDHAKTGEKPYSLRYVGSMVAGTYPTQRPCAAPCGSLLAHACPP